MLRCKVCDREFMPYMKRRVYCSDECYVIQKGQYALARRLKAKAERDRIGKTCKRCGGNYSPRNNNSKYCSACREILYPHQQKQARKRKMRIEQSKDGLKWFVMDSNDKIAKVFYSKESAVKYIKGMK